MNLTCIPIVYLTKTLQSEVLRRVVVLFMFYFPLKLLLTSGYRKRKGDVFIAKWEFKVVVLNKRF